MEEITESTGPKAVSSGDGVRYSAPELLGDMNHFTVTHPDTYLRPTTCSDTYSFAMLILECITEKMPFSNLSRDDAVIHARIGRRQLPPRPDGQDPKNRVSDDLWTLMVNCWTIKPGQRPTMEDIHNFFLC